MMETEEKYKVVIVDDERTAIDALRRELETQLRIFPVDKGWNTDIFRVFP